MSNSSTINLADVLAQVEATKTTRSRKPAEPAREPIGPFLADHKGSLLDQVGFTFHIAKAIWHVLQDTDQVIDLRAGTAQGVGDKRRLCVKIEIDAPAVENPLLEREAVGETRYAFQVTGRGDCNARESGTIASVPSSAAFIASILRATSGLHNVRTVIVGIDSKRSGAIDPETRYDAMIVSPNTSAPSDVIAAVVSALRPQGDAIAVALYQAIAKKANVEVTLPEIDAPKVSVRKLMKPGLNADA
jgi:hypothetical protein